MSKDDGFLYTGINSASSEDLTPREAQREEKEQAKRKLKPSADVILDLLAKERHALYDVRTLLIDSKTTDEEIKIERLLRRRHEKTLIRLETKIKSILKVKPSKEAPNE